MSLFVAEINTAKDQAVEAALETIGKTLAAIGVLGFLIDWIAQKLFAIWSQPK